MQVVRDSSVGIAIHQGLNGPGIESRRRRTFPQPSRLDLEPTHSPIQLVPGLFPWNKAVRAWHLPPTQI